MAIDFNENPHRRFNPLLGEWLLVSPHRTKRPWQGQQEATAKDDRPQYDPKCYLCPGNTRANGEVNPHYTNTYVFVNDFSALIADSEIGDASESDLFKAEGVRGECRVICFSPRHDLTLAQMEVKDIRSVVDTWAGQITELGSKYAWVQLFENKGAVMGCSNPHPHGQLWASNFIPTLVQKETDNQLAYFKKHGRPMLMDVVAEEKKQEVRVVKETEHWLLVVPFWAVWPYEYLLLPKRQVRRLPELTDAERDDLAVIVKDGLMRYDQLFDTSFPYSMGWHGAPNDGEEHPEWVLHAHYYPPLLRSATVKKFMVGYEMLGEAQRDVTAEMAAAKLRELPGA